MAPFIKEIIKAGVRVLLYYGDTDMACNFIMGQQFSASLNLPVLFPSLILITFDANHFYYRIIK